MVNNFFVVVLGLIIGSFLNVCIYRIPNEESIIFPPSHCGKCKHNLKPQDVVPVLSFMLLRGRCRYCSEKISIKYPIVESLNGILYLLIYLKFGMSLIALKYFVLVSLLIVIGMIDYDSQFVFTSTTIFGGIVAIIFILIQSLIYHTDVTNLILGGVLGFGIIGTIVFITKGMGTGDIEIAAVCGLFLGVKEILIGLFIAIILGGVLGVIILVAKLKGAKEKIPFGPFIAIGNMISML
jgi:leader peptidase (prepilin peptidase)/N-methyltransferase